MILQLYQEPGTILQALKVGRLPTKASRQFPAAKAEARANAVSKAMDLSRPEAGQRRNQGGSKYPTHLDTPMYLLRALWSLLDGIWGLLKGTWGGAGRYLSIKELGLKDHIYYGFRDLIP